MRFAFAIVSLFPGGGLQRDCVEIARRIRGVGHEVVIFTSRKSADDFASDFQVQLLDVDGRTNHRRQSTFSYEFRKRCARKFDLLVGFDKLAGLDVLYCSDRSIRARLARNPFLKLLPRYRSYVDLERECFARNQKTTLLMLSEPQLHEYWSTWTTEQDRLIVCRRHFQRPGVSRNIGPTVLAKDCDGSLVFPPRIGRGSRFVSSPKQRASIGPFEHCVNLRKPACLSSDLTSLMRGQSKSEIWSSYQASASALNGLGTAKMFRS